MHIRFYCCKWCGVKWFATDVLLERPVDRYFESDLKVGLPSPTPPAVLSKSWTCQFCPFRVSKFCQEKPAIAVSSQRSLLVSRFSSGNCAIVIVVFTVTQNTKQTHFSLFATSERSISRHF